VPGSDPVCGGEADTFCRRERIAVERLPDRKGPAGKGAGVTAPDGGAALLSNQPLLTRRRELEIFGGGKKA